MAGGWQINLNDAFCHGHTIENNLLFNWVRETQDHGPINTWNRAAYMHVGKDGEPTNVPEWTHISHVRGTSRSAILSYGDCLSDLRSFEHWSMTDVALKRVSHLHFRT